MKKILGLAIAVLVLSTATTMAFALENNRQGGMTNKALKQIEDKAIIKTTIKNHLSPVIHGYGIGFTDSSYLTAKWNIVSVKTLNMSSIKGIVAKSNSTNWSELRKELENSLQLSASTTAKGRIDIGKTNYLLTNITTSNTSVSADIRSVPDYDACKQANTTAEVCDINAAKIGSLSLVKKTQSIVDDSNAKVWAGSLAFNGTTYTFVSFAYPRWDQ